MFLCVLLGFTGPEKAQLNLNNHRLSHVTTTKHANTPDLLLVWNNSWAKMLGHLCSYEMSVKSSPSCALLTILFLILYYRLVSIIIYQYSHENDTVIPGIPPSTQPLVEFPLPTWPGLSPQKFLRFRRWGRRLGFSRWHRRQFRPLPGAERWATTIFYKTNKPRRLRPQALTLIWAELAKVYFWGLIIGRDGGGMGFFLVPNKAIQIPGTWALSDRTLKIPKFRDFLVYPGILEDS